MFTLGGRVQQAYRLRLTREATRISLLGAGLLLASTASAVADDPRSEIFTGLEASNNAISGYLGAGYAFGKGLYASGWRIRAVGSLGRYDYRGTLFGAGSDLGTTFDGDVTFAVTTALVPPASPLQVEALAALVVPVAVERAVRLARGTPAVPGLADAA